MHFLRPSPTSFCKFSIHLLNFSDLVRLNISLSLKTICNASCTVITSTSSAEVHLKISIYRIIDQFGRKKCQKKREDVSNQRHQFKQDNIQYITYDDRFKAPLFALLISRYILRLGQAAQKQHRPRSPNPKMYLEIRRTDERLLNI